MMCVYSERRNLHVSSPLKTPSNPLNQRMATFHPDYLFYTKFAGFIQVKCWRVPRPKNRDLMLEPETVDFGVVQLEKQPHFSIYRQISNLFDDVPLSERTIEGTTSNKSIETKAYILNFISFLALSLFSIIASSLFDKVD